MTARVCTVQNVLEHPGTGSPIKARTVSFRLNVPSFDGTATERVQTSYATTDATGLWSISLPVNDDLDPAGTSYTVREGSGLVWTFVLPGSVAGQTVNLRQVLVDAPTNPDPLEPGIGPAGPAGPGVADGGTTGQVLAKASPDDFDTEWIDPAAGPGGGVASFNTRTGAVSLTKPDVTGTGLAAADVGADASGAAAAAQTAAEAAANNYTDAQITAEVSRADAAYDALGAAASAQAAAIAASQPLDTDLTAIAALATTAFGRSVLTQADAAALRTLAGLGTAATQASTAFDTAGAAAAAQAASQPLDSDLTAIAALTTTAFGRSFLALADAAAGRTLLGLGTAATADTGTSSGQVALLSTGGRFDIARLGSGTPDGTKFVRDDGTLATPAGGGVGSALYLAATLR